MNVYDNIPELLKEFKAIILYPSSLEYGYSRLRKALRWRGVNAYSSIGEGKIYVWTKEYSPNTRITETMRVKMEEDALKVYQNENSISSEMIERGIMKLINQKERR